MEQEHRLEFTDIYGDTLGVDLDVIKGGFKGKQYASFAINLTGDNVILDVEGSKKLRKALKKFEEAAKAQEAIDRGEG